MSIILRVIPINGYQKNAEFYADFKFVDADLNKRP